MRTVVVVAAMLVISSPLAAQGRDTVIIRQNPELERGMRLEERRLRSDLEQSMRESAREVEVHGRDLARVRELQATLESRHRQGEALSDDRLRALEAETALRLDELRPTLEARGRQLDEMRPALRSQGRMLEEMRPALEAQGRRLEELRPTLRSQRRQLDELRERTMVARPRLGINVALEARETDNVGAYVNGVTPGGPADKAGLRAGDIVRKIGKTSLTSRDNVRRPMGESVPGLKLIEVVGRLEAGKPVDIEFRRGSRDRTVKITPEDSDEMIATTLGGNAMVWRRGGEGGTITRVPLPPHSRSADSAYAYFFSDSVRRIVDSLRPSMYGVAPSVPGRVTGGTMALTAPALRSYTFTMGGPLGRFEMTSLNPGLGSYFGATEGVLVIKAPEKDNFGMVAGDVITAVDGRKVTTPSQLIRIIGTYEKNEELKLQVMRQKRAETVSITLP